LPVEADVRPVGENEGRPGIAGTAEPAHLDDAASGRRVSEGLDSPEAHMVGATVGTVDHRVGLTREFVMQPGVDEAPDDGR
jgi:hypothetical protein